LSLRRNRSFHFSQNKKGRSISLAAFFVPAGDDVSA
jgi:hypothetical protein